MILQETEQIQAFTQAIDSLSLIDVGGSAATLVTIWVAIQKFGDLLTEFIKKELSFWQENRHKLQSVKTNADIEERRLELETKKAMLKIQQKDVSIIKDVMAISMLLKDIRESVNAHNVTISVYHNGIAKGFKNYSVRFEEPRKIEFSLTSNQQSKPLAPFYPLIERFAREEILSYVHTDTSDVNKFPVEYLKLVNVEEMFVIPMLIPEDENILPEHKIMPLVKDEIAYYILGVVTITFDEESKHHNEDKFYIKNKVDDIVNIYERNNRVFS